MDRAYVTCHMAISLDGKIDGDFHESLQSEEAGKYYYDVIFDLGSSMAGGSALPEGPEQRMRWRISQSF